MQNELIKTLVEFGNYLLSDERRKTIVNENNLNIVTGADIYNFLDKYDATNADNLNIVMNEDIHNFLNKNTDGK